MTFVAPDIDYAGISPIIALTAGLCLVLMSAVFARAPPARHLLDAQLRHPRCGRGPVHLAVGRERGPGGGGAAPGRARPRDLADLHRGGGVRDPAGLARRGVRPGRRDRVARPSSRRCVISSLLGMVLLAMAQNLIVFFVALELLSVPLYVLCGAARRRSESLESGLKYLIVGSLGSATLLYGLAFIYGGSGSTDFNEIADRDRHGPGRRPADPHRHRLVRHRARLQALRRALPPVDARRLPGRAHPGHRVHGRCHEGGRVRGAGAVLRGRARPVGRRLAARARGSGRDLDRRRQRGRPRPGLAEAPAGLLRRRPGGLHAGRRGGLLRGGRERARLLPRRLRADEPRSLRGDHAPRAPDAPRRLDRLRTGAGRGETRLSRGR